MSNLNEIETFAIIDLEANNLPDRNFNKANITELCIHTISKNDLASGNINVNPRIVQKLIMLFNPQMLIDPEATKITGLDNYMLEHENCFDKNAGNTIIGFLNHLRQPVCLVAHNGDKFDFPVLKRTFEKLEMSLPENLLCLDTYTALKVIDEYMLKDNLRKINKNIESDVENDKEFEETLNKEYSDIIEEKNLTQKLNESTPKRPPEQLNESLLLLKRQRNNILSNHDDDDDEQIENGISTKRSFFKSRRVLFPSLPNNSSTPIKSEKSSPPIINYFPSKPKFGYYRLENIYKRLFTSVPLITHQAEADVIMLQKIMTYYGKDIVEYSEHNAKLLSSIPRLGTPQGKKRN